jgi:itaconate CoA-transferase
VRPLDGITVVAIEQAVAAPFATRQLADLGARVIKIERPDGGDFAREYDTTVRGLSSYFVWLNRSKESLTLDLKRPAAAAVLIRLLERADVFVQNLAPGAADRLGASSADLRARYPRLIVCNVSGYGASGPYASMKAYDLLVQSEVGLVSITGTDAAPSKAGISIADIAAGVYAYSGVLTALLSRTTTGCGTTVDISLFDALAEWMSAPAYYTAYGGLSPPRSGSNHASIAPYGRFQGRDGHVYLGIQNTREWTRFCMEVLQRPELTDDERFRTNPLRVRHRDALHAEIEAVLGRMSVQEITERLASAHIACARMNSVAEFIDHPQLAARACWRNIDSPSGSIRMLVPPVRLEGIEPSMGAVPSLGQHTHAILTDLGFDANAIAAWRKEGMI